MRYFVLILAFGLLGFFLLGTHTSYSQTDLNEMNYSQFLDFCSRYNPELWDSMSIEERLLDSLCDFVGKGFGEKQWNWLNGARLDWGSFAKNASESYAYEIPEFIDGGIKETLRVDSFVSGRDSFPPPMIAMISFDYEKLSQVIHYDEKFTICINGKLVPQESFIQCSDEYVNYNFTKEEPLMIPKFVKPIPLPEHTRRQMLDWCQNSPKWAKIDKQFWDTIPVRLVSNTDEFISLQGIKESFVASANAVEQSCPPNVWVSGTFASKDGKRYKFALEYNSDHFRYQIDKRGLVDDEGISAPRQQMKMGVPLSEIKCKEGLELILKSHDDSPTCVRQETKAKLIGIGWMKTQINTHDDSSFIESTKNLKEVQLFLSLHPNAEANVNREWFTVEYSTSGFREHPSSRIIQHTKQLIIGLDYEGRPSADAMICGGPVSLETRNMAVLENPDWCFQLDQSKFNSIKQENEN